MVCSCLVISMCRYIPLTPVLEGYVILKENPEYHEDHWCFYVSPRHLYSQAPRLFISIILTKEFWIWSGSMLPKELHWVVPLYLVLSIRRISLLGIVPVYIFNTVVRMYCCCHPVLLHHREITGRITEH